MDTRSCSHRNAHGYGCLDCGAQWQPVKVEMEVPSYSPGSMGSPPTPPKPRPESDFYTKARR